MLVQHDRFEIGQNGCVAYFVFAEKIVKNISCAKSTKKHKAHLKIQEKGGIIDIIYFFITSEWRWGRNQGIIVKRRCFTNDRKMDGNKIKL